MNLEEIYAKADDKRLYQRGVNNNLRGLNTQFRTMEMQEDNHNLYSDKTLNKYNVIRNDGLSSKQINKPYKLVLTSTSANKVFNLDIPLKDVLSVKLIRATSKIVPDVNAVHPLFLTLKIDELNKNVGEKSSTISNSFALLHGNNLPELLYNNDYSTNEDIKYFDPPINSLSKLTCKIESSQTLASLEYVLEFLIETKTKLNVY